MAVRASHQQHQQREGKENQDGEGVGDDDRRPLLRWVKLVLEEERERGYRWCCRRVIQQLASLRFIILPFVNEKSHAPIPRLVSFPDYTSLLGSRAWE